MRRSLLIAGGTVGGLGAVLAITPPQLTSNESMGASAPAGLTELDTPSPAATSATPTATAKPKSSGKPSATPKSTPTPQQSAASKGISGAFTGSAVDIGYGIMQVKITVVNGKITEAEAVQTPSGRNDRWTNMAVPVLRQRTLEAQSANINGVSGASYTSYGWYTSLVAALKQAGL
jgi:uncharacterized protein with FMN-binding domain